MSNLDIEDYVNLNTDKYPNWKTNRKRQKKNRTEHKASKSCRKMSNNITYVNLESPNRKASVRTGRRNIWRIIAMNLRLVKTIIHGYKKTSEKSSSIKIFHYIHDNQLDENQNKEKS